MAAFTSRMRKAAFALGLLATFAAVSSAHASDMTVDWPAWNAASPPIFPGETWQRYASPEEAGWSSASLDAAMEAGSQLGGDALFVVYNGAVLAEWGQTARRMNVHSVRKSLMSALYGIAVAEGKIDISASVGALGIDEITPLTETEKSATVADLLETRSGIYLPAAYESRSMKRGRPERGSHAPGSFWYYNNWDFNALGTIYNQQTGSDLFRDFETRLARPTGMQDFSLRHTFYRGDPDVSHHPAYLYRLTARDMARFGLLFLNEGRWRDSQLIPADWVAESTRAHVQRERGGGYGYMWWTFARRLKELGTYAALGNRGQTIIVVPAARLVLVHKANTADGHRVETGDIVEVLVAILKARTGPPAGTPKLVPAVQPVIPGATVELGPEQQSRFTGAYKGRRATIHVVETKDGLEIADPRLGQFRLLAQSDSRFLIEDLEREAVFTANEAGDVTGVSVENRRGGWADLERVRN